MNRAATSAKHDIRAVLAFGLLLSVLVSAGVPLGAPFATSIFCLLLLLVGLPHGALDIERLKQAHGSSWRHVASLFLLYIGLAALMLIVWQTSPILAMGLFLCSAVLHFAEDWEQMPDPILALGTAAALLCVPALLHKEELGSIFAIVTGAAAGALLAEIMQTIAPVALALTLVGMIGLVRRGEPREAICCAVILAAMLLAPPIAGFALFFCVFHSPRHLGHTISALPLRRRHLLAIAAALTATALALTAALARIEVRDALPDSLVAATFMTFSILTVPHMLVPQILKWRPLSTRRATTYLPEMSEPQQ